MRSSPSARSVRWIRRHARSGSASGRSGSGPRAPTTASRFSLETRVHSIAPRRSAYDVRFSSRSRTWPTGGGAAPGMTSNLPISPRCTCTNRSPANSTNRCLPADSAPSSSCPSSTAASAENRPWGLLTRTGRPPNATSSSAARRWRVCPSGIGSETRRGLWQRRQVAGGLVVGQHPDPSYVTLLAGERGAEEELDEPRHLLDRVHPPAHGDHVGVVVLPGQARGLLAPRQGRPHSRHLVGRDLLAVD